MTPLRSFLFIPGDSEKKLAKTGGFAADALILDLEDAVASSHKQAAREIVSGFLGENAQGTRLWQLWVRINPLDSKHALSDLAAIVAARPDGIVLPKVDGPEQVLQATHYLDALETAAGVATGSIGILPVATETAKSPFRLGDYTAFGLHRLYGLTWGAEDLSSAIGATSSQDSSGDWAPAFNLVRSLTLLGAHAAAVEAVDTVYVDFRDADGLRASSRAARSEGFSGRLAIHPAQVDIINACFSPSEEEVEFAQRVVELFAANPDSGVFGLDGRMLDIPHLKQARNTLALHEARRN